jgi:long-chain acyl-CoA synthetase
MASGTLVLSYRFHPAIIAEMSEKYRPYVTAGAITAYIALMNEPSVRADQFTSYRTMISGGAPTPLGALRAFEERFGIVLRNGYGMTETSGIAIVCPLDSEPRVDADTGGIALGKAIEGFTITIVADDGKPAAAHAVGEIVMNSSALSCGYWLNEDATRASRCEYGLKSGDVGKMDEDGYIYIVDRKKDVIIAGGYKVWPREVEDVLYQHPAVREAAVVGVADDYRGETVKAVVSLRPGIQADPDEIREFCKDRLAAYKYPRIVEIIDELPKTVTGKVLRRELRDNA